MLVVTPNLCFDRTLWVDRFEAGTVSRPDRVVVTAGGKGVNVARTLRDLGHRPLVIGLVPAQQGDLLVRMLREEGAVLHPIPVPGAVRSATIVIERSGRATVLNEPGPAVSAGERDALVEAVATSLDVAETDAPVVVCSGSLPPGLPVDTYAAICRLVHEYGGVVLVDAAREVLAATLAACPDLVTPNLDEAEGLMTGTVTESSGQEDDIEDVRTRALQAACGLRERGARRAVVTAGVHGAAYVEAEQMGWVEAPRVEVTNPIGAGDSFVGGLAGRLAAGGHDWWDAVRYAVTVASAAVEQPGAGRVDAGRARALADQESVGTP